eukprot:1934189-Pyramimonas_sp.AAC.2
MEDACACMSASLLAPRTCREVRLYANAVESKPPSLAKSYLALTRKPNDDDVSVFGGGSG